MDLKDIATISGKGGLFKVLKPARTGVILESLDNQKVKTVAGPSSRVSILKEISIYTTGKESSVPLSEVLSTIFEKNSGNSLTLSSKSANPELLAFMSGILPNYDTERVYVSDIKKLVTWYNILVNNAKDLFQTKAETESETSATEAGK